MSLDKHKFSEQELVAKVKETLDASVERMDAETRHRIIAARQHALAQDKQRTSLIPMWGKAGLATAFTVLVAILVVKTYMPESIDEEGIEAMELIAAQDTLEMYEELEFYTWLAEEDVTT